MCTAYICVFFVVVFKYAFTVSGLMSKSKFSRDFKFPSIDTNDRCGNSCHDVFVFEAKFAICILVRYN